LTGGAIGGIDSATAASGIDRLIVDYSEVAGNVSGGAGSGTLAAGYNGTITNGIDTRVDFSGVEHFTITTAGGNDNITTGDGSDTVSTGAGNDIVNVGAGVVRAN